MAKEFAQESQVPSRPDADLASPHLTAGTGNAAANTLVGYAHPTSPVEGTVTEPSKVEASTPTAEPAPADPPKIEYAGALARFATPAPPAAALPTVTRVRSAPLNSTGPSCSSRSANTVSGPFRFTATQCSSGTNPTPQLLSFSGPDLAYGWDYRWLECSVPAVYSGQRSGLSAYWSVEK